MYLSELSGRKLGVAKKLLQYILLLEVAVNLIKLLGEGLAAFESRDIPADMFARNFHTGKGAIKRVKCRKVSAHYTLGFFDGGFGGRFAKF